MRVEDRIGPGLANHVANVQGSDEAWHGIQERLRHRSPRRTRAFTALTGLVIAAAGVGVAVWAFLGNRGATNVGSRGQAEIAFARDGVIYVVRVDGSGLVRLSDGIQPAWSPDGQRIAFATNRDGNFEIYVMEADGSRQHRLTRNPGEDVLPTWSPDGTRVAFSSDRANSGQGDIYVMSANGAAPRRLTESPAYDAGAAWSPDGTKIVFTSDRDAVGENGEIYMMDADGSGETRLTRDPAYDSDPTWSPDGTRIAFVRTRDADSEIYVMHADGTGQVQLTDNDVDDACPAWSPDGRQLVLCRTSVPNAHLYVMDADGTNQVKLTEGTYADGWPAWRPAWKGIWPQDTREEGERAQAAADGGPGRYDHWQLGSDGDETVLSYALQELGWAQPLPLDIEVPEDATGWLRRWRVIRCAPGVTNADYPEVDCAPPDGRSYPAAYITIERLLRHDERGLWIVTAVEPTTVDQPDPASPEEVRGFVTEFLERRLRGSGAEGFISPDAEKEFGTDLGLSPLYSAPGGPGYERYQIVFVDGPLWPFATFGVGVRIHLASGGSIEETLFVGPGTDLLGEEESLVVRGGSATLSGP